jgi:hypothetical protein
MGCCYERGECICAAHSIILRGGIYKKKTRHVMSIVDRLGVQYNIYIKGTSTRETGETSGSSWGPFEYIYIQYKWVINSNRDIYRQDFLAVFIQGLLGSKASSLASPIMLQLHTRFVLSLQLALHPRNIRDVRMRRMRGDRLCV